MVETHTGARLDGLNKNVGGLMLGDSLFLFYTGAGVGSNDGDVDGTAVGANDGAIVGTHDGDFEMDGWTVGCVVG